MKTALRATAILSGSSLLRILIGAVSAKGWALIVGPIGVGVLGLVQSLVSTIGLVAGLGISTVLVRLVSEARARGDDREVGALWRGATVLTWATGLVALAGCWIARSPLAEWTLGDSSAGGGVVLAGLAVLFTVGYDLEVGLLNSYSKIETIAKASILCSIVAVPVNLGVVAVLGVEGVPWAVATSSVVTWVISKVAVRVSMGPPPSTFAFDRIQSSVKSLLKFGLPYMASTSMGLGVQRALPILLVSFITVSELGIYRAAAIIVAQLGFLTTAMGQDYYPRVSAATPETLSSVIRDQIKIVTFIGAPTVVLVQTFSEVAIRVLFTPEFGQAADILRLQVPGFMLLVWSLPFSYSILGRQSRRAYLILEVSMGLVTLGAFGFFVLNLGLIGTGIAYTFSYFSYLIMSMLLHDLNILDIIDVEILIYSALVAISSYLIMVLSAGGGVSVGSVVVSAVVVTASVVGIKKRLA